MWVQLPFTLEHKVNIISAKDYNSAVNQEGITECLKGSEEKYSGLDSTLLYRKLVCGIVEPMKSHVDKSNSIDIIYLEFQESFDKVPHQRFQSKLSSHRISG